MAIALFIEFPGGTLQQYETIMQNLGMELHSNKNIPDGLISHIVYSGEGSLRVIDVWESRQHFDKFLRDRLGPALRNTGLPEPRVNEYELYNVMIGKGTPVPSGMR